MRVPHWPKLLDRCGCQAHIPDVGGHVEVIENVVDEFRRFDPILLGSSKGKLTKPARHSIHINGGK